MIHFVNSKDLIEQGNYKVNSFHSKVIDKLGENLNVFLEAQDGEIEGIYNLEKKIIGVQFHMENKGVSENLVNNIHKYILDVIKPDLTFLLKVSISKALQRLKKRKKIV